MLPLVNQAPVLVGFRPSWSGPAEPEEDLSAVSPEERRRLRRMISNRESARRSRARKQRHLEELRGQAGRLRFQNHELADRLGGLARRCLLLRQDNDRLRAEASALCRRLADLRREVTLRQFHRLAAPLPLGAHYELAWASQLMVSRWRRSVPRDFPVGYTRWVPRERSLAGARMNEAHVTRRSRATSSRWPDAVGPTQKLLANPRVGVVVV
ncbi:hypothetical protein BHE74_00043742 [Ensete ventricosum]|nr:hypothetical protein BHE74_00043742 [Ensete ventricosum]